MLMDLDVEQLRIPVSTLYSLLPIRSVQLKCDLLNLHWCTVGGAGDLVAWMITYSLCRSKSTVSSPGIVETCPRSGMLSWSLVQKAGSSSQPVGSWALATSSCPRPTLWTMRMSRWERPDCLHTHSHTHLPWQSNQQAHDIICSQATNH